MIEKNKETNKYHAVCDCCYEFSDEYDSFKECQHGIKYNGWKMRAILEEKINRLRAAEKRLRKHLSADEFGVVRRTAEGFGQEADWLEELKRYRDLEEQGRLLVLPCKPNSDVFIIRKRYTKCSHENVPFEERSCLGCIYECDSRKEFYIQKSKAANILWIVDNIHEFGDTVFLTYEEAEAELMRRMNVL